MGSILGGWLPRAVAVGTFDGVHRGHQRIAQVLLRLDPKGAFLTFTEHPRGLARLLSPWPEKRRLLEELGVGVLALDFNAVKGLAAKEFVALLRERGVEFLVMGPGHGFGRGREAGVREVVGWAPGMGVSVVVVASEKVEGQVVSSGLIREMVAQGRLREAERALGRPYWVSGRVVKGEGLGARLGFPTANLSLPRGKLLPPFGVYLVRWEERWGLLHLGPKMGKAFTAELHVLDWEGDLYGRELWLFLCDYIRPPIKFTRQEDLRAQIERDVARAKELIRGLSRGCGTRGRRGPAKGPL